jgi:Tol biopolymer transport system component
LLSHISRPRYAPLGGLRVWIDRRRMLTVAMLINAVLVAAALGCSTTSQSLIAFSSDRDGNREVYTVDPSTGDERNLTESIGDEFAPTLSPDGKLVAFLSSSGEDVGIEVIEASGEGRQRKRITGGPGRYGSQQWAPDGSRLAYIHAEVGGQPAIYIGGIEGKSPLLLTKIRADEVSSWSPNGKSVAFSVREGETQGVYTRNPDGVNEFRLTETSDSGPIWSPDSKRFAFISVRDGNPEIYIMNVDGTEQRRLTETDAPEYDLSWSPNGEFLMFVRGLDSLAEIYITDPDAAGHIRLTHNEVRDDQPVWSPNGKQIAFVSYLDGDAEIFLMGSNGGEQTRLTNNEGDDTSPSW